MGVAKDFVLFQIAAASIEDTDTSVSAVVNFVLLQGRVGVRFDPNPGHGVVEDFVVF